MTTARQLDAIGRRWFGYRYLGTFALNEVPHFSSRKASMRHFIINTQTSNLPGQHWIGVTVYRNIAYVYDSFGLPPPALLVTQLRQRGVNNIYYNRQQIQPYNTTICGHLTLQHLRNADLCSRARGLSYWKTLLH